MKESHENRSRRIAFIGLGANLEDPRAQLVRAIGELAQLPHSALVARSSLWDSSPLGYADQPEFVNAVALIESGLSADALLDELQRIERAHGRARSFPNAPRTLDLDLLLFGDEVRATPRLTLPHPRMHARAFVLKPLLEIAPGAMIPGHGTARACLAALKAQACERIA
ncbi:MAG: 2-amino-4-hydroxy-6-hydroxymethyldihydropteridine diphosphokinase [Betaproteobacteria bacterium]|nr:2-amino-4-hydroxy-6-hydroxymethyldihydropteridine diphosphokinase [Betaproteobacteria bacterium]